MRRNTRARSRRHLHDKCEYYMTNENYEAGTNMAIKYALRAWNSYWGKMATKVGKNNHTRLRRHAWGHSRLRTVLEWKNNILYCGRNLYSHSQFQTFRPLAVAAVPRHRILSACLKHIRLRGAPRYRKDRHDIDRQLSA